MSLPYQDDENQTAYLKLPVEEGATAAAAVTYRCPMHPEV